jgi:hypothetical protein
MFDLFSKFDVGQLSGRSKIQQYGALVFDACPGKKPIEMLHHLLPYACALALPGLHEEHVEQLNLKSLRHARHCP